MKIVLRRKPLLFDDPMKVEGVPTEGIGGRRRAIFEFDHFELWAAAAPAPETPRRPEFSQPFERPRQAILESGQFCHVELTGGAIGTIGTDQNGKSAPRFLSSHSFFFELMAAKREKPT